MKRILTYLSARERNEITYWMGLTMLFIGLALSQSVTAGLVVIGAVMAAESVLTSYLVAWFNNKRNA